MTIAILFFSKTSDPTFGEKIVYFTQGNIRFRSKKYNIVGVLPYYAYYD